MPPEPPTRIEGDGRLILVAPHGGHRDPVVLPWRHGGLRTNDLHTADLTVELARRTGASAIVNRAHDRNHVDCNRVEEVATRHPSFLDAIHDALARAIDAHGRAVLVTIHGWNTIAPAIDVGLGCRPGAALSPDGSPAAVGPTMVTHALPTFGSICDRRGITVSVGRRYPARARQNLIQLFTGAWLDDARAAIARVAAFAPHCDAMQLELGVPLRWPGPWREAFAEAFTAWVPTLLDLEGPGPTGAVAPFATVTQPGPWRLDFVSEALCGMAAIDARGCRLLLVDSCSGLDLFTHDWAGTPDDDRTLRLGRAATATSLRYRGPVARFTTRDAFLDLEAGLATAGVREADVGLDFEPRHAGCPFGTVSGTATIAGRTLDVHGPATSTPGTDPPPLVWAEIDDTRRLWVHANGRTALVCNAGRHTDVACRDTIDARGMTIETAAPEPMTVRLTRDVHVPIVRGRSRPARTVSLATYRAMSRLAGWGHPDVVDD